MATGTGKRPRLNVSVVSVAACLRDISIIPDIIQEQQCRNRVKTARPGRRKCNSASNFRLLLHDSYTQIAG